MTCAELIMSRMNMMAKIYPANTPQAVALGSLPLKKKIMRVLVFDQEAKAEVTRVKEYAELHPFSIDDVLDRKIAYDRMKTVEGFVAAIKDGTDIDVKKALEFFKLTKMPTEDELFIKCVEIMKDFEASVPGNNPGFVCHVKDGFRVAFTLEDLGSGMCRHMSVSLVDGEEGKVPSMDAIAFLMNEFDFKFTLKDPAVYVSLDADGAVNVLERSDGSPWKRDLC